MKTTNRKTLAALIFTFSCLFFASAWSQDGEALFSAKCSACHILGKDATGPNLVNVKSRWEGEEEQLFEWVKNPAKVIAQGNSDRAQEVKGYSPTEMPVQNVSLDEAKAIIEYVDAWTPPQKETADNPKESTTVVVPDYDKNLSLFYGLLAVIGFLLLAIFIVSRSTASLIKSDLFKKKVAALHDKSKGTGDTVRAIILLVGMSFISSNVDAFSFEAPAIAKDINVWVYIEQIDLYVLLIIALLLLGFLMHMINMFYKVLRIMKPKKKASAAEESQSSITRVLTGATPIEEEDKIDTGHEYDGIRELDNPMPPWWLAGFFISIVFAVIYMFHYHVLGTGDLQTAEYNKSMEKAQKEIMEYRKKMAMNIDETNATLMVDDSDLMKGKTLFNNNCTVCHTESGGGDTGPNLTDDYWIYGNDIKDVFKVIKYGTPNGMPKHESKFNPVQLQQVASYVLHLELVTMDQGGLEPQGDLYGEASNSEQEKNDSIQ